MKTTAFWTILTFESIATWSRILTAAVHCNDLTSIWLHVCSPCSNVSVNESDAKHIQDDDDTRSHLIREIIEKVQEDIGSRVHESVWAV